LSIPLAEWTNIREGLIPKVRSAGFEAKEAFLNDAKDSKGALERWKSGEHCPPTFEIAIDGLV
jgi:hypothetical protein